MITDEEAMKRCKYVVGAGTRCGVTESGELCCPCVEYRPMEKGDIPLDMSWWIGNRETRLLLAPPKRISWIKLWWPVFLVAALIKVIFMEAW